MKILSPAGDPTSLKLAIYNGADEVYLGIKDFNARNNIKGFDLDELKDAIAFSHTYGVKVYLTVNILFSDDELQDALNMVVDAHNLGIDAFIVQDIGLVKLIKSNYPDISLHASTQMGVHNLEGVRILEKLGFSRVVLSRETPLNEIERISKNSAIEIEYFVHGALCVSFSGNCYMSSYLENASGNRGRCKQLCRLPYSFNSNQKVVKEGYLLSAKDICMIDYLDKLKKAGVTSLKIEGRARRPYYVAVATKTYRNAVDGRFDKVDMDELKLAFNREFTPGYFENNKIISDIQSHNGLRIGTVVRINNGKKFNEIFINTNYKISPKSSLKFFRNNKEIATISPFDVQIDNNITKITTTTNVKVDDIVHIFVDYDKEKSLNSTIKKINVDIKIFAYANAPLKIELSVQGKNIAVISDALLPSINSPLTIDDFYKTFSRSEIFSPNITDFNTDNIFIHKSKLNEIRRICYDKLYTKSSKNENKKLKHIEIKNNLNNEKFLKNFKFIEEISEIDAKSDVFILNSENFCKNEIIEIKNKCENLGKNLYLNLPYFATQNDINILKDIVKELDLNIMINNLYGLEFESPKKIAGYGLNIFNSHSANYFNLPYLIAESHLLNNNNNNNNSNSQKAPYMILRHCPLKELNFGDCSNCKYSKNLSYKSTDNKSFKLKRWKVDSCTFYLTD